MKRAIYILLFILLHTTLSGQSYVYEWYFNINNEKIILNNAYTDTLRVRINKPMDIYNPKYLIDIYTVGKAFRITTDKYQDTTAWIGSTNRDSTQNYPFKRGYAFYKDGNEIALELPCDSIPEGYFGLYNFQWGQNSEDCYDYFRYELTSYSSEEFVIHFNLYQQNILYLFIQVEENGSFSSTNTVIITEDNFQNFQVYDLVGNRIYSLYGIPSGIYIAVKGNQVYKTFIN